MPPAPATAPAQSVEDNTATDMALLGQPVGSLLRRQPVYAPLQATAQQVAQIMQDQGVSSVLLVEDGRLHGIVTDSDLRNRLLAKGLPADTPVVQLATMHPHTAQANEPLFKALMTMARHDIHHLPVMEEDNVTGMLSTQSVTHWLSTSPVFLASTIHRQTDLAGLVGAVQTVPQLLARMAQNHATAQSVGHVVTSITDAVTVRLLQMAEADLGPPPVEYAWVAAGSQGRSEQTAQTDQDNCLVLADTYRATHHADYFQALATRVCDGLNACGYVYCPGEMMAMNPTWRMSRSAWAQCFSHWIAQPDPKALMLTSVFFDLRAVYGQANLLGSLRQDVLEQAKGNGIFLAHLIRNALSHTPPLGLWGRLQTARTGEHRGTIDLKHRGLVPIVDLARVYALAGQVEAVNTTERLSHSTQGGEVSVEGARDLLDTWAYLSDLRIQHQRRQIERGEAPNNFLKPSELSNFERQHLKQAFATIATLQEALGQRHQTGRL